MGEYVLLPTGYNIRNDMKQKFIIIPIFAPRSIGSVRIFLEQPLFIKFQIKKTTDISS